MSNPLIVRCGYKIKWVTTRFWLMVAKLALKRAYAKWQPGCGVSERIRNALAEIDDAQRIVP